MSYAETDTVTITTDSAGDATGYLGPFGNHSKIATIIYTKDDYAAGVDFTVTTETTGQNVWVETDVNASATRSPRQATHDTSGNAETYDGTNAVNDYIFLTEERIKIVVAQGGDTKSGSFRAIVA